MTINSLEILALIAALIGFAILWFLDHKKHVDFGILTLLATAFGILIGVVFHGHYSYVAVFGRIFTAVLNAFVVPLLLVSVIASVTNLSDTLKFRSIGLRSVLHLALQTALASAITIVFAKALNIGAGFSYTAAEDAAVKEVPSFADTLIALFPSNIADNWANNRVLPIIIFSLILGLAYNSIVKEHPEVQSFKTFLDAANKVLQTAIISVIDFTPYAVLSLIARAVGRADAASLLPLLVVLVLSYLLCGIFIFIVEPLFLRSHGLSPLPFLRKFAPAAIVAFTSQSSTGTLPVTTTQLKNELGVNENVADFTATLGTTIGMPGCAGIWPTITAVFVIHSLGLNYSLPQYLFLILLSVIVSAGTIGVPGTATITATALFAAAGLPVEYVILFSPISSIVDMARTATNVTASGIVTVLVAKETGNLNEELYYGKSAVKAEVAVAK